MRDGVDRFYAELEERYEKNLCSKKVSVHRIAWKTLSEIHKYVEEEAIRVSTIRETFQRKGIRSPDLPISASQKDLWRFLKNSMHLQRSNVFSIFIIFF